MLASPRKPGSRPRISKRPGDVLYPCQKTFARLEQDIPITKLRAEWDYRIWRSLSLSVGVQTAVWWDVPVPPGVIPGEGGDKTLHENTIVFVGGRGGVKFEF